MERRSDLHPVAKCGREDLRPTRKITKGDATLKSLVGFCLFLFSLSCSGQAIEEYFLNATVLIRRKVDAQHLTMGSGFLILREVSKDLEKSTTSYQIILVTNKHLLPVEKSDQKQIAVKIAVRDGGGVDTKELSVNILGPDGLFLKTVAMNANPRVDVAAVNITREMGREDSQYWARAKETGHGLVMEALLPVSRFKAAGVG